MTFRVCQYATGTNIRETENTPRLERALSALIVHAEEVRTTSASSVRA